MRRIRVLAYCLLLGLLTAGCSQPSVYDRLQSEDPAERVGGIVQAVRANDADALPYLVDRLDDPEPEVRLFAEVALRQMTGETFGYRHYADQADRDRAVAAWREWLRERAEAAEPDAATQAATPQAGPEAQP